MKNVTFLLVSEALLILFLVLLFSGWKGSVGFNAGWPLSQFSMTISGGASGAMVAGALLSLVLSSVTLVAGLIGMMKARARA
jgi:hypothetical protein